MEVLYTMCAYCERTTAEICKEDDVEDPESALEYAVVGGKRILLCETCRAKFAPQSMADIQAVLEAPVEFPPGITAVEHVCPELQHQGKTEEEAELELIMHLEGEWYTVTCPFCGVTARSKAGEQPFGPKQPPPGGR